MSDLKAHVVGCLAAAIFLVSCDIGSDEEGRKLGKESIATGVEPVPQARIAARHIRNQPAGSAARSLLRFWSHLQLGESAEAAAFYEDSLIGYLGSRRIAAGLATQGEVYRSTRPIVVRTCAVDERRVVVLYRIREDGQTALRGMTWADAADEWVISYDPLLDRALKEEAEKRVQSLIDPAQQVLSDAAVDAGAEAARKQFRYVRSLNDPALVRTTRPADEQMVTCREAELERADDPGS